VAHGSENNTLIGKDNLFTGYGGEPKDPASNIIYGGAGDDRVFGGFGEDALFGGSGNDYIISYGTGPGNPSSVSSYALDDRGDVLDGGAGNDYLGGGGGDDILIGGSGNDTLAASQGQDVLYGGAGDDILRPGDGADILYGGAGADTFVYRYTPTGVDTSDAEDGRDVIMDFETGTDTLDLRGYGVSPDELTVTQLAGGVLLSFEFLFGSAREIELRGLTSLPDGDILFS
jgi:Ca2+-binding RTX toxin-like protein